MSDIKESYLTIKEASDKVGVESHVLRYWEEELKMEIHRNQMGHRYYTEHDIALLCMVKKLKDKGIQLKAIRNYIEKRKEQMENEKSDENFENNDYEKEIEKIKDEQESGDESVEVLESEEEGNALIPVKKTSGLMSNAEKLEQFQNIMNRILSNAIQENNELIGKTAGKHAADAVVTKMEGMTKEQEERAEERFRKLDQTLREIQLARKEAAATTMRPVDKRKQQRLKRKNKNKSDNQTSENSVSQDNKIADEIADKNKETIS